MPSLYKISVGARDSALSKAQVSEVYEEVKKAYPKVVFVPHFVKTTGDKDQTTSLRFLGKTDFFTKEIDTLVLQGICRIGIHSAKDLPEPLPSGLALVALTRGLDPRDVVVIRKSGLPPFPKIGVSSLRREHAVKIRWPEALCLDIRGTIEQRLALLDAGVFDGVVMAECALLRLGLHYRERIILDAESAPLQGRLAVVAKEEDIEMQELFYETIVLRDRSDPL